MRFGKKLALQQQEDVSGAPYLSHKPMKEAINRTVRELRLYQAKLQDMEQARGGFMPLAPGGGGSSGSGATPGEASTNLAADLQELEDRVSSLDKQLFAQVDKDLSKLLGHVRFGEATISKILLGVQGEAMHMGLLMEESQLRELQKKLPGVAPDNLQGLVRQMLDLQIQCDPVGMCQRLSELTTEFNSLVEEVNQHSQYLEINVAGFRKLLKRHEKQIPVKFRARQMPFLGFHRLVTHTSHKLLEVCRQLGQVIGDAWQKLFDANGEYSNLPDMTEVKGLGPECEMVLKVQKQLKAQTEVSGAFVNGLDVGLVHQAPGLLYPKPEVPSQQYQHQNYKNQQQQLQQLNQLHSAQANYFNFNQYDASVGSMNLADPQQVCASYWLANAAASALNKPQ